MDATVASDDEDRRDGDVLALHRDAVGDGGLEVGVGQEGEADALFARQAHRVLGGIDADRDQGHALRLEVLLPLCQLT